MAEGKFVISAQNRIKEGLDAAQRDLGSFTTAAENLGKKLEAAFTATAIVAGLKKLGEATFDCYKEFGEAERRLNTLKIALDNNDASIRRATSLIESMSKMTLASKDDIEGLASELAALGKSDEEIEAITKASVNLSNVTGKDLNSAFTLVNATYSGTAGKLDKLLPQIGDLTKEQLAAGGATNLINERFGDLSAKLAANDIPQKLKNIKDGFSDLKENIGQNAAGFFDPMITELNKFITGLNKTIEAQRIATRQMMTQNKFNNLVMKGDAAGVSDFMAGMSGSMTKAEGQAWIDTARKQNPLATGAQAAALRAAEIAVLTFPVKLAEAVETIRTTTTGGAALGETGGTKAWSIAELYGAYKLGSGTMGQSGIPGRTGTNIPLQNLNIRDDLESYGWNAAMLAKPVIEFRDDLESYGWDGLAETAFDRFRKQWAKSVDEGMRPEEGGEYSPNYAAQAVREDIAETFQYWERVSKDFRDDLESYDWEGLVERILPTDGGGFRAQGQSTISGPIGGGGLSPAAQIASNMSFMDSIGKFFGDLASGAGSLISSFSSIKMLLDPISVILQGFMSVIGPLINNALQPLIGILTVIGQYLGQMLTPVLEALGAVAMKLAEVFVWLYNNILVPVGVVIMGMFNALANSVIGIANAFIQIRNGIAWMFGGNQAALIAERSFDQGAPQRIEIGTVMAAGSSSMAATASESASYRTQSITINIYQQAAVVGQAGMTEFARIIRGEFVQLGYLGQ